MSNRHFSFCFLMFLAVLMTGCNSKKHADATLPGSGAETIPLFQKNKGVMLPAEMRQQFGLEVAEVAERPMRRDLHKLGQVFRPASGNAYAAATVMLTRAEAKGLRAGQTVLLRARDSNEELHGTLREADEETESALGLLEGLIEFADSQGRYSAGVFLSMTFVGEEKPALAIPSGALLRAADGTFVYVANGEHFSRTRVTTGATSDSYIEIEDGLYAGDVVVTQGVSSLWLIELSALKGGKPCCAAPKKPV